MAGIREKRLIDANGLDRKIVEMTREPAYQHTGEDWLNGLCMAMETVNEAPTVDAVEVVHGRWKPVKYNAHCSCGKSYETYNYQCSACKRIAYPQPYGLSYCPNCGAKMDL